MAIHNGHIRLVFRMDVCKDSSTLDSIILGKHREFYDRVKILNVNYSAIWFCLVPNKSAIEKDGGRNYVDK